MRRTVDLSTLTCVCGARVSFHRIGGAQISCAEAIDRQLMFSDEIPQPYEREEPTPTRAQVRRGIGQVHQGALRGALESVRG